MRPGEPEREAGETLISFLLVVRNEERHVARCLESMLNQTLDARLYEIIVVDGLSTDASREIAQRVIAENPGRAIRLLDNPGHILACGWNIGLQAARGTYVIRPDAHADVPADFLERNLAVMERHPEAWVVGGVLTTKGRGFWGETIAAALSSRMGVGGSRFRTGGAPGPVDAMAFGLYRSDRLRQIGGFDERMRRNQDVVCHTKIRSCGGIIYFDPSIRSSYYCRDSLRRLAAQMFGNGIWMVRMLGYESRRTPPARYWAPLAFVLAIAGLLLTGMLWWPAAAASAGLLGVHAVYGLLAATGTRLRFSQKLCLPLVFLAMHVTYGVGSLVGLLTLRPRGQTGPHKSP